jgi:tubulin-folding cofactor B
MNVVRWNFNATKPCSKPRADDPYAGLDLSTIAHVTVGSRCLVRPAPNKPAAEMRGVVRYLGPTLFAAGYWVGIQLDEPMGLHDGEVKGERYFQCGPKYGTFVRPGRVECGDFPEESLLSDEDI